jgi:uncharacterized protein YbjT (DUF2867 family)
MRIVVIGGSGALGSKVVGTLRDRGGHDTVAASRSTGVNALTGERIAWSFLRKLLSAYERR